MNIDLTDQALIKKALLRFKDAISYQEYIAQGPLSHEDQREKLAIDKLLLRFNSQENIK